MRKISIYIITILLFTGCKPKPAVHSTFYFWKTVYNNNKTETDYLTALNSKSLYVRIMDVDINPDTQEPVPVSPVKFENSLPTQTVIIPVVYLVNNIFRNLNKQQSRLLADRISKFVHEKVKQAGKQSYGELQIDCDWTQSTRDKYLKAKCTFMLAKCEQKRIVMNSDYTSYGYYDINDVKYRTYISANYQNPYFKEMSEKYAKTNFFKRAINECSYMSDFIPSAKIKEK